MDPILLSSWAVERMGPSLPFPASDGKRKLEVRPHRFRSMGCVPWGREGEVHYQIVKYANRTSSE